jgi:hypothetical protein
MTINAARNLTPVLQAPASHISDSCHTHHFKNERRVILHHISRCDISGSHGGGYEDESLLG